MDFEHRAERSIDGLLGRVPGYRGYRAKEDRRDADRRVREQVAAALAAQADRVERVGRALANQRRIREVGPVEELARAIRHLADRVGTATYGYGGLFGDRDVDNRVLDQLRQFDESLIGGVGELEAPIVELERAYASGADLAAPARAASEVVRVFGRRFDLRNQVVETAQPAPEASVLELLNPPQASTGRPAYDLKVRDAVAILGDNAVVDARIAIEDGDNSIRLFRLSGDPERWLLVPRAADRRFALLSPSPDPYLPGPQSKIGGATYTVESSGSGQGELIGSGGSVEGRSVSYTLLTGAADPAARAAVIDWGNDRQVLVGKEVHPDDVEVFPAAGR